MYLLDFIFGHKIRLSLTNQLFRVAPIQPEEDYCTDKGSK